MLAGLPPGSEGVTDAGHAEVARVADFTVIETPADFADAVRRLLGG